MELPDFFTQDGLLPPGDYELTFEQLRNSWLVRAEPEKHAGSWDESWRLALVHNAEILTNQLWSVGISDVFLDGSFVEDKDHPNDIDGYFVCDAKQFATGELQRLLNAIDPFKVWTWSPQSRQPDTKSAKRQLPMWHRYRVELYPHFGQSSGIKDRFGNELQFPAAFRKSRREDKQKGIVRMIQGAP